MRVILLILILITLSGCSNTKKICNALKKDKQIQDTVLTINENGDFLEGVEEGFALGLSEGALAKPKQKFTAIKIKNPKIKIVEVNSRVYKETMNLGRTVYKIPSEMKVRGTHQVIVRISKSTLHIFEELEGEVKTTIIPVTETMEVKLVDPSPDDDKMFDIVPDNDGVQFVEDNESITEWTWNVTPKRSGETKLKIVISIIRDGVKKEKVYSDEVIVKSDIKKSSWYFIRTYWEWIISTLLLPFVIWFFTKRKKKKEKEED